MASSQLTRCTQTTGVQPPVVNTVVPFLQAVTLTRALKVSGSILKVLCKVLGVHQGTVAVMVENIVEFLKNPAVSSPSICCYARDTRHWSCVLLSKRAKQSARHQLSLQQHLPRRKPRAHRLQPRSRCRRKHRRSLRKKQRNLWNNLRWLPKSGMRAY